MHETLGESQNYWILLNIYLAATTKSFVEWLFNVLRFPDGAMVGKICWINFINLWT